MPDSRPLTPNAMNELLVLALNGLKVIFLLSLLPGGLVVLSYLGEIRFFPAGASLGDGLFFLGVTATFTFFYAVFFMFIFSGAVLLLKYAARLNPVIDKIAKRFGKSANLIPRLDAELGLIPLGYAAILFMLIFFAIGVNAWRLMAFSIVTVAFFYALIKALPWERRILTAVSQSARELTAASRVARITKVSALGFMMVSPLVLSEPTQEPFRNLVHATMERLGIRHSNVSVLISDKEFIASLAKAESERLLLPEADVLWHGVGKSSKLHFKYEGAEYKVSIDSQYLRVIELSGDESNKAIQSTPRSGATDG